MIDNWQGAAVTLDYMAMAACALVVAALLISDVRRWRRTWGIETRLRDIDSRIYMLETHEADCSRRWIMELNEKINVKPYQRDRGVEKCEDGTAGPTFSPATATEKFENGNQAKLPDGEGPL